MLITILTAHIATLNGSMIIQINFDRNRMFQSHGAEEDPQSRNVLIVTYYTQS